MDGVRLGVVIWAATLGYWLLYNGAQRLSSLGQAASTSSSTQTSGGTGGAKMTANELGFLAQQPIIEAMA